MKSIQAPTLEAAASCENQPVQEAFHAAKIEWKQIKQDILSVKTRMTQMIGAYQESLKKSSSLMKE